MNNLRELSQNVRALFDCIDEHVSQFQASLEYACVKGCGQCCQFPEIEVTVLDCIPLAWELAERGEAVAFYDTLSSQHQESTGHLCPLYQSLGAGAGHCGNYPNRPSLCRLFGFAAVKNKTGRFQIALCQNLKSRYPTLAEREFPMGAEQGPPSFEFYAAKLCELSPDLGSKQLPIAQAMKVALEKVLIFCQYESCSAASKEMMGVEFTSA